MIIIIEGDEVYLTNRMKQSSPRKVPTIALVASLQVVFIQQEDENWKMEEFKLSCSLDSMGLMLHVREKQTLKISWYTTKIIRVNRIFKKMRKEKKKTSINSRESGKTVEILMSDVIENRVKSIRLSLDGFSKAGVISKQLKILLIFRKGKLHLPKSHAEFP